MVETKRQRFSELSAQERAIVIANLKRSVSLDKSAQMLGILDFRNPSGIISGGYDKRRGMRSSGHDERWSPGYEDLHGVDFVAAVERLRGRFPGAPLSGLDVGCGYGRFGHDLMEHFNRAGRIIDVVGTNIRLELGPRGDVLSAIPTKIMVAENLKFPDESFHLVVTTSAATLYTNRLDLVLDELHRVAKPGGEVYFQGLPEGFGRDESLRRIEEFGMARKVDVLKNADGVMDDAFWFAKPMA